MEGGHSCKDLKEEEKISERKRNDTREYFKEEKEALEEVIKKIKKTGFEGDENDECDATESDIY